MLLAAIVLAAIITEKNGTFADAPAHAAVSIPSSFIPYGTYTDGNGSTEYMRVGTNLVGAVASLIDGLWERVAIPYGWLPGEYPLHESARDTKRILATAINYYGSDEYGSGLRYPIEQALADGYVYETWEPSPGGIYTYKTNALHAGIAGSLAEGYITSEGLRFRDGVSDPVAWTSRKADDRFFGAAVPPISTTWSAKLPFLLEDVDDWQVVFPVYSAYEYDPHFFPSNYEDFVAWTLDYARPHIHRWMLPEHLVDIWGVDVYGWGQSGAGADLHAKLKTIPISTNAVMEEVLKIDPGFDYVFPPIETNSYWDVYGPLGNFRLYPYMQSPYPGWDNESQNPTNYHVDLSYYNSSYTLFIFDNATSSLIFIDTVQGDEDSDVLEFSTYHAQRTRIYTVDDFAHWRNMTTRLDWKRLGIIAQLERHLETTYRVREREDYLPLWEFFVRMHRDYTGSLTLHVKIEDGAVAEAYVVGHKPSLSLQYASWAMTGESAEAQTNRLSASYPTARTIVNLDGSIVQTQWSPIHGTFDVRDDEIFDGIADAIARFVRPWPTGTKRIRVDLNITTGGMAAAMIFVWYGSDDVRSFSVGETPFSFFVVPDIETEDTFLLQRDDAKIARDVTTLSNNATEEYKLMGRDIPAAYPGEMSESAVSNLEARLWADGYIKSITLPTIEVRLAATNDYWASQLDAEPVMPWHGQVGVTNEDIRAFRYQCDVKDSAPLVEFRGDRLLALRDLNSEVRKHFRKFAGRDITTGLAGRAAFNAAEIAAFNNAIAAANATVTLQKTVSEGPAWIEAEYDFGNGWKEGDTVAFYHVSPQGTNVTHLVYSTTNYVAHPYGEWNVYVSAHANPAITNSGIRVDAHQNQMMKTLWKFKNMRDPGL